jgi:hypothetical protein
MSKAPETATVEAVPPEAEANNPLPGDVILTHGKAWTSKLIRVGQALRFRGESRRYTWWNHTAVVVSADGDIVEALGAGVQRRNLSVYRPTEYRVVRIEASDEDRRQMVEFAETCVGLRYGYATIASIALSLLTGSKFSFGFEGQYICSGLVSRCLERTGYLMPARERLPQVVVRSSANTMPAHLAEFFRADPPPKGASMGTVPDPHTGRQAA